MKLSTYPRRFLTDREVATLLAWIPTMLIQLDLERAKTYMEKVVLPLSRGQEPQLDSIQGLPPDFFNALASAIRGALAYHTDAEHVGPGADKDNPVEAGFQWILKNWNGYVKVSTQPCNYCDDHVYARRHY